MSATDGGCFVEAVIRYTHTQTQTHTLTQTTHVNKHTIRIIRLSLWTVSNDEPKECWLMRNHASDAGHRHGVDDRRIGLANQKLISSMIGLSRGAHIWMSPHERAKQILIKWCCAYSWNLNSGSILAAPRFAIIFCIAFFN